MMAKKIQREVERKRKGRYIICLGATLLAIAICSSAPVERYQKTTTKTKDKTKQNKTKQNKTKQDKTKQNKK